MEVRTFLLGVGIGLVPLAMVIIGIDGGYLVGAPPALYPYMTNTTLACIGGLLYALTFLYATGLLIRPAWRWVGEGMLATLLAGLVIIPISCQVLPRLAS